MSDLPATVDVVGVGLNATDTIIRLPRFPELDSKVEILSVEVQAGGQVASAMVACQRWGLKTRYVGKVGADEAGRLQARLFAQEGVEAHVIEVPGAASQIAYILVDEDSGERTILWKRDADIALKPEDLRPEWITQARALHVDGHDTGAAATAARWARLAGIPVTADLDNVYPGVEALLPNVDYLITSRQFPERVTGETDLQFAGIAAAAVQIAGGGGDAGARWGAGLGRGGIPVRGGVRGFRAGYDRSGRYFPRGVSLRAAARLAALPAIGIQLRGGGAELYGRGGAREDCEDRGNRGIDAHGDEVGGGVSAGSAAGVRRNGNGEGKREGNSLSQKRKGAKKAQRSGGGQAESLSY